MIPARIRSVAQSGVRLVHTVAFDRGMPAKVGVYGHDLRPAWHGGLRAMLEMFRDEGYRFAAPDDFLADPGERCVFVSFDDNYRSWYDAIPVLAEEGVRVTFYVNTCALRDRSGTVEIDAYYDRLGVTGPRVPLSTDELRALDAAGHTIGTHTHSHRALTGLPHEVAMADIRRGKEELEAILGKEVRHFAYPYGMRRHFDDELRAACASIGFTTIANAIPGLQHVGQSPLSINRSGWRFDRPVATNRRLLCVDGSRFEAMTGRSAVG